MVWIRKAPRPFLSLHPFLHPSRATPRTRYGLVTEATQSSTCAISPAVLRRCYFFRAPAADLDSSKNHRWTSSGQLTYRLAWRKFSRRIQLQNSVCFPTVSYLIKYVGSVRACFLPDCEEAAISILREVS